MEHGSPRSGWHSHCKRRVALLLPLPGSARLCRLRPRPARPQRACPPPFTHPPLFSPPPPHTHTLPTHPPRLDDPVGGEHMNVMKVCVCVGGGKDGLECPSLGDAGCGCGVRVRGGGAQEAGTRPRPRLNTPPPRPLPSPATAWWLCPTATRGSARRRWGACVGGVGGWVGGGGGGGGCIGVLDAGGVGWGVGGAANRVHRGCNRSPAAEGGARLLSSPPPLWRRRAAGAWTV